MKPEILINLLLLSWLCLLECFDAPSFEEMFCEVHAVELNKMEARCLPKIKTEARNVLQACLIDIRNKRAPYKQIDGKYRQLILCDFELTKEMLDCEKKKFKELNVSFNVTKEMDGFKECLYQELLILKRMEESKKKTAKKNAPKSSKVQNNG